MVVQGSGSLVETASNATSRETQTSGSRDDDRTHGISVLKECTDDVTSLRTAVRIHTRIIMVSWV